MQTLSRPAQRATIAARGASRRNVHLLARRSQAPRDQLLLDALLEDRPHAWTRFLSRFDDLIEATIRRWTGGRWRPLSEDDRGDIRSIFLESLLADDRRKLRAYEPAFGVEVTTWIALLVKRCACDYVRAAQARVRAGKRALRDRLFDQRDSPCASSPEHLLAQKRRVVCVLEAARKMAPRERELFELHYERGLPAEEVASLMGTKIQTVYATRLKVELHLTRLARPTIATPRAAADLTQEPRPESAAAAASTRAPSAPPPDTVQLTIPPLRMPLSDAAAAEPRLAKTPARRRPARELWPVNAAA